LPEEHVSDDIEQLQARSSRVDYHLRMRMS
jgi:hypothetical protein